MDLPNGNRVEEVELFPARFSGDDQACVLEQPQVLHDAESGHVHLGLELGERAAVALEESVEEKSPGRVCQCLEDEVVVGHRFEIR